MKIKPYRKCDICGNQYDKSHMAIKVKYLDDSMGYVARGEMIAIMEKMDICPECSEKMIEWIRDQRSRKHEDN